ncbi:MAG: UDP-2,3-diacylglucosamine diphosphatase LpxI [Deltaproteobacteria bacterium]|jgi:DUF1009 family protein|nr:UDP-2,3-diacylglucosamine diphosphatase LpxI [Deltaproteobacteria bacterium]
MADKGKIGIVAGAGQFPRLVAEAVRAGGGQAYICCLRGFTDADLEPLAAASVWVALGQLGKLIRFFKAHQVTKICMAGAVSKSKALHVRPDWRGARILLKAFNTRGDDALLRLIAGELAADGLELVQAAELAPALRGPAGVLTRRPPAPAEWDYIRRGWGIGKTLGRLDIGQCLVMYKNTVAAVEAMEGTDATLRRAGELAQGCIALKMLKPGQDTRLDLPSLGLATVEILVEHHYACLAYEAGSTLFFDLDKALKLADEHKIAIVGIAPEQWADSSPNRGSAD